MNRKLLLSAELMLLLAVAGPWTFCPMAHAGPSVSLQEHTITLPTYVVGPPDSNPRFYSGRTYQGAKATFYPYPVFDQMTEVKSNRLYRAVTLENEYIQFSVLPEIGGRIFTAVDKGNGYDFFYRQHSIKPALIGMLGAWISGGVEWNIPHHHRASSFMPVDYTTQEGSDGSRTVWVGETELRHRMKWVVGMTLRPGYSYIEMTVKLFNRTPEAQSFLFWINPAVHANTNYQVLFPPSTEWAVQHGKPEFAAWPIARQVYGGTDYRSGVDISWWRNHPSPVSFFAWDCREDFFGGYDHGRRAGVAQISNHHVSPGKKFFEWGNGPEGEMWSQILSDGDGPYLELMAGSYSDNQPDYSWVQPGETKVFKHYWYPIRELGGLKNANTEAALNLDVTNGMARLAVNTTRRHTAAKVSLSDGQRPLLEKVIEVGPNKPFVTETALDAKVNIDDLRVSLTDASGHELISWQPQRKAASPMPKPVQRPLPPAEIASVEELYLTGLRVEQLYSPSFDPVSYYKEILKRDPGDYRANTALGSLFCRQGRFEEAEPLLEAASARARENYIRPKTCEADYYLGTALRAQGKLELAWDAFYRAIWDRAWQGAGYAALAELACRKANYLQALELVDESLANGSRNTRMLELRITLLRRLNRRPETARSIRNILELDPLNHYALNEERLRFGSREIRKKRLLTALRGEVNSYLELSMDYANCGLWEEAAGVLGLYLEQQREQRQVYPLVLYYIAYFEEQLGQSTQANKHWAAAAQMAPALCFPFQFESEPILQRAMDINPKDSRAAYYLGNLLFDHQPSRAIALWEKTVALDESFAVAHRNLALGLAQTKKDVPAAIQHLERAAALEPRNPRLYYELDLLYEWAGAPLEERLLAISRQPEIVAQRDDALTRRIVLLTAAGQTGTALQILRTHHFRNWEGSSSLHGVYANACLRQAMEMLQKGEPAEALKSAQAACDYPENQEIGRPRSSEASAKIHFFVGRAYEDLNQAVAAQEAFKAAADATERRNPENDYFRGQALRKLKRGRDADKVFQELGQRAKETLEHGAEAADYFAKFGEKQAERVRLANAYYQLALAQLGNSQRSDAELNFKKALELDPAHLGALTWRLF